LSRIFFLGLKNILILYLNGVAGQSLLTIILVITVKQKHAGVEGGIAEIPDHRIVLPQDLLMAALVLVHALVVLILVDRPVIFENAIVVFETGCGQLWVIPLHFAGGTHDLHDSRGPRKEPGIGDGGADGHGGQQDGDEMGVHVARSTVRL